MLPSRPHLQGRARYYSPARCGGANEVGTRGSWRHARMAAGVRSVGASGCRLSAGRRDQGFEWRRASGRAGHHRQNRHRDDPHGDDGRRRVVRVPQPAGRSVPVEGRDGRLQHPGPGRHRPAGQHQSDPRPDPDRRQHRRAGHCRRELRDDREPFHRRRPGHRQRAGHADSAERPPGDRIDFPVGPGHVRARRRSQHQQELSDRHDLGRRGTGQRHHLHHGRRHPQRSVQQPEPADAVSRCAAGVQGGDQLAAGEIRPSRGVGGEPRDQVRDQFVSRERVRVRPRLPLQRAELLCGHARQPQAQPVRRHARRSTAQGQAVLLRRLSGQGREDESADDRQLRAHGSDARGGLQRDRVTGLQRAPDYAGAGGRLRQQHDQPDRLQPGGDELPGTRAGLVRPVRPAAVRRAQRQHRAPVARTRRLHAVQLAEPVRALHVRGLRQSRHLRRRERLDAQPDRAEQPGALAGGRTQLDGVGRRW